MSRPGPKVLLEFVNDEMRAIQVCEADAIFAVFYKGAPIKVRTFMNIEVQYPGPKYAKASFPEAGHAFNLAEKLNKQFNTTEFSVVMLNSGRVVQENK